MTMMSADETSGGNEEWHKKKAIYPPASEIAVALQDLGKEDAKGKQKFTLVEKLAAKVFANIKKEFKDPEGLTKNASRGKMPLVQGIVMCRKHVDIHETNAMFHQCGKDGKVFIIANDPETCGLDKAIVHYQRYIQQSVQQKNSARTPNDGIRLASTLLDSNYRGSVSGLMSKKKDRRKSDITGDPALHFYEMILMEAFSNPDYTVTPPLACYYHVFPEDEKGKWEPNNPCLFEQKRTATWLKETWETCVRPKYKKALDKWNKDTGGGDGTPTSCIDFCGSTDRWLVWVFCKDLESNFLLANSAGGRMPRHLQVESGFVEDPDVSDLSGNSKTAAIEDELVNNKKSRERIEEALGEVAQHMREQKKLQQKRDAEQIEEQTDKYLSLVTECTRNLQDETILDSLSPNSRRRYTKSIKRRRKQLIAKMDTGDSSDENENL